MDLTIPAHIKELLNRGIQFEVAVEILNAISEELDDEMDELDPDDDNNFLTHRHLDHANDCIKDAIRLINKAYAR